MIERQRVQTVDAGEKASTRGVAALVQLELGGHGRGFSDYTLSPERGLALDPFLVLSDFQMPQPFSFLLAHGRPLGEPVVFGGPFVMNTSEPIAAARERFARGEMGRLEPSVDFGRASRG